jgi:hypothetical protein
MNLSTTSAFDLPDHLTAKAAPALIAGDEQHFAAIERTCRTAWMPRAGTPVAPARRPWTATSRSTG